MAGISKKHSDVWEHNASTGNDVQQVVVRRRRRTVSASGTPGYATKWQSNGRIIRMGVAPPYFYCGEFWGDYSRKYPKRLGCSESYAKVRSRVLAAMRRSPKGI